MQKQNVCFLYYQHFSSLLHREGIALKEKGFNVDIICLGSSRQENKIHYVDGLKIIQIQTRSLAEKNVFFYFFRLGLFFLKALCLLTFLQIFKKYKLIHVTTPPDFMVFAAIIPKLLGAKIIMDIHDIGPELYMRKLNINENKSIIHFIKFIEKTSAQFSHHVITVTDLWKKRLVNRSINADKCSVLLNVPDERIFKPRPTRKKRDKKDFTLYYHGSLEEHFGIDTLIEAMPMIKEKIPQAILYIYAGKKGRLFNSLQVRCEELNLKKNVLFCNYVFFSKLPLILENADIGIVPTKGSTFSDEAVSMKSFDYIFLGIPIVISKTKAHSYYYSNNMVKFFEPGNNLDLAKSIIDLFINNEKRDKMVSNSRIFIQEKGWNHYKKTYYSIIENLMTIN